MDIGVKIRKQRIALGYRSAEKFAFDHGINRSVYERWEQGKDMLVSNLILVAKALKVEPSELLK